ncbi:unnamed protein product [Absidia cylindrospora]
MGANVIVTEGDDSRRPDYVVDIYRSYVHQYSSCVGEIKSGQANSTSMVMENIQSGELQINNLLIAKDNKDALSAKFFDLPKLNSLCLDANLHFDYRLTTTSFDKVYTNQTYTCGKKRRDKIRLHSLQDTTTR